MQQAGGGATVVPDGRGLRIGLVVARFNAAITARLHEAARSALQAGGVLPLAIEHVDVPGAFELPVAAKLLAASGRVDAVACLGCVLQGETPHFDYICSAVAHGLTQAALETGVPIAFGVLTTSTREQAEVRSQPGHENKGFEAACAAIEMARVRAGMLAAGATLG